PVVEFSYRIPALGLERTVNGSIAGEVQATDETSGESTTRRDQGGVLLELQLALRGLELEPVPEDCEGCVLFSYALPVAGESAEGWLTDVRLLASVENLTSALLGPHFPEGTVAGLRRSATPYQVAHTVALLADGSLWRWRATEARVAGPDLGTSSLPDLATLGTDVLADSYSAPCPAGSGVETLRLSPAAGEALSILIVCPGLALPAGLLPYYLPLEGLADEFVAEGSLEEPPAAAPTAALLVWRREDSGRLTLLSGAGAQAVAPDGLVFSGTLTATSAVSLTAALIGSDALVVGVEAFLNESAPERLFVRGPEAVYSLTWEAEAPASLAKALAQLEALYQELLAAEPLAEPVASPNPTP
ncbi:MAG: hypothetical protein ACRDHL_14725, partial [Candidatus Promineifilaceae bacterium]